MPYFDNVNMLFIHIPKTGGTSLESYFSNKYNIQLNYNSLFCFLDEEIAKKQKLYKNTLVKIFAGLNVKRCKQIIYDIPHHQFVFATGCFTPLKK